MTQNARIQVVFWATNGVLLAAVLVFALRAWW